MRRLFEQLHQQFLDLEVLRYAAHLRRGYLALEKAKPGELAASIAQCEAEIDRLDGELTKTEEAMGTELVRLRNAKRPPN